MATRAMGMIRWLGEGMFGVAMAAGVFVGLTGLVTGSGHAPIERIHAREIRFTRLVLERPQASPRPTREPLPRLRMLPRDGRSGGEDLAPPAHGEPRGPKRVAYSLPTLRHGTGPITDFVPGVEGTPIPVLRIPPEYPPNARGEGSVLVQFDITAQGTVANARVVEATPRGVFERAALQAIARWRYRPAVRDGRAVERRGVQVRLRFELEKA